MRVRSINPITSYLYSLQTFGMKFGLRNIRSLLHACGDPHTKLRTIHIAGTNGKGSTSSMIAAILTAAGYRVGLYTSPHLVSFNERIRINGRMIPEKELLKYVRTLRPTIDKVHATFFEATTAIALKYFFDQRVDIAVIETGLGGRLDSTNVITPLVSVITSIGKDHTQYLGTSLRSIATEKAGIIKQRIPVVIGSISGTSRSTILACAKGKKAPVIDSNRMTIPDSIQLELKGIHQLSNARAAIAAVTIASQQMVVGDRAVKEGLERTTKLTGLRARCEIIKGKPDILLDVAHNPDGMATLVQALSGLKYKKFVFLFAVMKDKDFKSMLRLLRPLHPAIVVTQPAGDRALSASALTVECKRLGFHTIESKNISAAFRTAMKTAGTQGLLVITGSHYLIGEVLPFIEKKP